jgi:hypothetical protein
MSLLFYCDFIVLVLALCTVVYMCVLSLVLCCNWARCADQFCCCYVCCVVPMFQV